MKILFIVLLALDTFFALAGVVGMLRMPDSFCRMQSSTNIATFGTLGVIIVGAIYSFAVLHNGEMGVKILMLGVFYIVTNPIGGHAIAKGAYHHGVRPEKEMVCDKYGEDLE